MRRYRRIFASLFIEEYKFYKNILEEKAYKEIAFQALVLVKLGIIKANSSKCKQLAKSFSDNVEIKYIDLQLLEQVRKDLTKLHNTQLFTYIEKEIIEESLWECNLFVTGEKNSEELFGDFKKKPYLLFMMEETGEKINGFPFKNFLKKIEQRKEENPDGRGEETGSIADYFSWRLVQDGSYLITDRRICNTLIRYRNDFDILEIETNSKKIYKIIGLDNSAGSEKTKKNYCKNRKEDRVSLILKDVANKVETVPNILFAHDISEKEREYRLWVSKVFPGNRDAINLANKNISYSHISEIEKGKFLILPFTTDTWGRIKGKKLSKEQFLEIAKDGDGLNVLIEWVYVYQINKPRLNRKEIQIQYDKLLEKIYNWLDNKNTGRTNRRYYNGGK